MNLLMDFSPTDYKNIWAVYRPNKKDKLKLFTNNKKAYKSYEKKSSLALYKFNLESGTWMLFEKKF